ncbi:MAG TPA: hypothetical protein VKY38_04050 [Azoarcus sp.]|nr:hypothetical protein [Azoarcus sp.]
MSIYRDNLENSFSHTEEIDIGYVAELPAHFSSSNVRELFGLREGETVAEAIARHWID